jgi:hypothetical protein
MVMSKVLCLVVVFTSLACGCARQGPPPDPRDRYVNPPLPDDQVAFIKDTKGGNFLFPYSAVVIEVDGKAAPGGLRVTPGRHVLVVAAPNSGQVNVITTFEFDFVAGHAYRVDRIGPFEQRPKVIDETTGKQYPIYAKPK